jgi:hypothetical protein
MILADMITQILAFIVQQIVGTLVSNLMENWLGTGM